MEYSRFRAMNTDILMAAEGDGKEIAEGFRQAEAKIHSYERKFTRFSEDSELSSLNRSAGTWFPASPEMMEVMQLAQQYYRATRGLFNPGILKSLEQAGYDRSMDEIRQSGARISKSNEPLKAPDFNEIGIDEERQSIRLPEGMWIDLGGIAKGWITERVARLLYQFSDACGVNAGGDMFLCGLPEGQTNWSVGLEDPFHPGKDLAVLSVAPGAVATSSVLKRRWKQGNQEHHHLIDPRTGLPADEPWVSATVITSQAARAEALAKALLIAGPEEAGDILQQYPEAAFVVVDENKKMWGSDTSWKVLYGDF